MAPTFLFDEAFSRNIGWVTAREQQILRGKRVAIAGLGGVGGSYLLTLTRLGIGRFNISDFDKFELVNFNRQAGASLSHLGRPKVDVLAEMARDVNPELVINAFPAGVNAGNVREFLADVDLYLDGLDFFAIEARRAVFAACAEMSVPALTAAPLGMGVSMLTFLPGGMTFEVYFRMEGHAESEQLLRFLLGLSPVGLQMRALVDPTRLDLEHQRGPSTPMGCELCAGFAGTQVMKILLHRGPIVSVPRGLHVDAYSNRRKVTWRPGGNNNVVQRLALAQARRRLAKQLEHANRPRVGNYPSLRTPMGRVLEEARWAPSGDNTQPWRFELTGDRSCVVHASDTRDWCVYDLEGRASQIAVGALLETIAIAASNEGCSAVVRRRPDSPETAPLIDVELVEDSTTQPNPLYRFIRERVTQRRPFSAAPLSPTDKQRLEDSLPPGFKVVWVEDKRPKWEMAKLLFRSAQIRLTIPEAYKVHKEIIEWDAQHSEDRIPDQAVGLDPLALKLMRWALQSWERVRFMNRYLAGTWIPRQQLDLLPGRRCAAHFLLVADAKLETIDDYLAAGRATQRFWLTAANLGLQFQPEMTPLIFTGYARAAVNFTQESTARKSAEVVAAKLASLFGAENLPRGGFLGRVGYGAPPIARSTRLPLSRLIDRSERGAF